MIKDLKINDNDISFLPSNIGELKHLSSIDLSNTLITNLPDSFANLIDLRFIYMNNLPINELPQ